VSKSLGAIMSKTLASLLDTYEVARVEVRAAREALPTRGPSGCPPRTLRHAEAARAYVAAAIALADAILDDRIEHRSAFQAAVDTMPYGEET
jgi:hypothetical protein